MKIATLLSFYPSPYFPLTIIYFPLTIIYFPLTIIYFPLTNSKLPITYFHIPNTRISRTLTLTCSEAWTTKKTPGIVKIIFQHPQKLHNKHTPLRLIHPVVVTTMCETNFFVRVRTLACSRMCIDSVEVKFYDETPQRNNWNCEKKRHLDVNRGKSRQKQS
jgi:hypothetical protein